MSNKASKEMTDVAEGKCPDCGAPRPDVSTPCASCGAAAVGPAEAARESGDVRRVTPFDAIMQVRSSDIEPYIGLKYLSKLFKLMAIILLLLLVAEIITGLRLQGSAAIPTLLAQMSRLIVLSGLLWGSGDLAILLIDMGHDVRATRILLGRQAAHHLSEHHDPTATKTPPRDARTR